MICPEYNIRLHTSSVQANLFDELLAATGFSYSLWDCPDDGCAVFSIYAADAADAEQIREQVVTYLGDWESLWETAPTLEQPAELPREDWAESWKRHFVCTQLSPRIVVTPSWERERAPSVPAIVEIDPGMAFGTGLHGTTRACLELLDDSTPAAPAGTPAIDMGCGTGILAIAAAKLGWSPVAAVDLDEESVRAARENVSINGCADRVSVDCDDLTQWQPSAACSMVMVNILAPVLIAHSLRIGSWVAPGGALILSGILTEQFPDVSAAYTAAGFRLQRTCCIDKWTSGLFKRPAD